MVFESPSLEGDSCLVRINEEQKEAFSKLVHVVTSLHVLVLRVTGLRYSVQRDLSAYQRDCTLLQTHEDRKQKLIG